MIVIRKFSGLISYLINPAGNNETKEINLEFIISDIL